MLVLKWNGEKVLCYRRHYCQSLSSSSTLLRCYDVVLLLPFLCFHLQTSQHTHQSLCIESTTLFVSYHCYCILIFRFIHTTPFPVVLIHRLTLPTLRSCFASSLLLVEKEYNRSSDIGTSVLLWRYFRVLGVRGRLHTPDKTSPRIHGHQHDTSLCLDHLICACASSRLPPLLPLESGFSTFTLKLLKAVPRTIHVPTRK